MKQRLAQAINKHQFQVFFGLIMTVLLVVVIVRGETTRSTIQKIDVCSEARSQDQCRDRLRELLSELSESREIRITRPNGRVDRFVADGRQETGAGDVVEITPGVDDAPLLNPRSRDIVQRSPDQGGDNNQGGGSPTPPADPSPPIIVPPPTTPLPSPAPPAAAPSAPPPPPDPPVQRGPVEQVLDGVDQTVCGLLPLACR